MQDKNKFAFRHSLSPNLLSTSWQRHHFANKGPYRQGYGISSGHVLMWDLDHKEDWAPKNWCFWIVILERTIESPSDSKEIKAVSPKGNQPEYSLEGLVLKLKLILWLPYAKGWLIWKKLWCWEWLRAREEGYSGWDGWMASLSQWIWVWTNFRR